MTIKDDMEIRDKHDQIPSSKINIVQEMKNSEREIRESSSPTFKKTTYWNQQKSGLADSSSDQILKILETLEQMEAQLARVEAQSQRIEAQLEMIQARAEKRKFI
ncbi:MAG: hypothetical protein PHW03_06600 [Eubacteriales bacterium]|nr:hypothetical protein [Eubacteriales bacterium]MDD4390457.1 hypothetical protein [Eubacteriales bacterium]